MVRTAWMLTLSLVVVSLALLIPGSVRADFVVASPPVVSYYYPPPTVTYYSPPVVYATAPPVSNYYGGWVSYYQPSTSYYVAPSAVTSVRYGLFGYPRVITRYYPPVYVGR